VSVQTLTVSNSERVALLGKSFSVHARTTRGADRVENDLMRGHKRRLVLGSGSSIQLLELRLIGEVDLDGGAFQDDYIVAGVERDGDACVLSQVLSLS